VLKNIANRMLDIAVNMALFGSISGMGSKGGGLLGLIPGLDKRAKGGVYAQNGIQAFARGGIVNKTHRCSPSLKALALWVKLVLKPSCPCAVAATAT
jgi:hypothetical protein